MDAHRTRTSARCARSSVTVLLTLAVVVALASAAVAGDAKLVKDIERSSGGCQTSELVPGGGALYFGTSSNCRGGAALWRSDGSFQGTFTVKTIVPVPSGGARVQPLLAVGDVLYFGVSTSDQLNSGLVELWRSDGTEQGTALVRAFDAPSQIVHHAYPPATETAVDGKLLFFVGSTGGPLTPWVSDGTELGTHALVALDAELELPVQYLEKGDVVLFVSWVGDGYALFRSDGTSEGTFFLRALGVPDEDLPSVPPTVAIGPDGAIWFTPTLSRNARELWRTQGTPETTARVVVLPFASNWALAGDAHVVLEARRGFARVWRLDPATGALDLLVDFAPPPLGLNFLDVRALGDGVLFFSALIGANHTPTLWRTDGSPAGTFSIFTGYPYLPFFPVGDGFAFEPDGGFPRHLWHTDGTVAGTVPIHGPDDYSGYEGFVSIGDAALLVGDAGDIGADLLRTDGTSVGTTFVRRLPWTPDRVGTLGDAALLVVGSTLWRSDGSAGGTFPLVELGSFTFGAFPADLTDVAGELYFTVAGRHHVANELWRSDGSRAGTKRVADFPDADFGLGKLAPLGDRLLFARNGHELWTSDGTRPGTTLLADVHQDVPQGELREIRAHDGAAFVAVRRDRTIDGALLRVDEQPAGTPTVTSIAAVAPSSLTTFSGDLFFSAPTAPEVAALWRSNGTAPGTAPIATFSALNHRRRPEIGKLLPGTGEFYFSVGRRGRAELWRSNGTGPGTTKVASLPMSSLTHAKGGVSDGAFLNGVLLFSFVDLADGPNLWRSDGTEDGTKPVTAISPYLSLTRFTPVGGKMLFVNVGVFVASSLWVTDGTELGTEMLSADVFESSVAAAGDAVYFCGVGEESGRFVLYRTDGTTLGTVPVFGRGDGCTGHVAPAGDRVYFTADTPRYGHELWSLAVEPTD